MSRNRHHDMAHHSYAGNHPTFHSNYAYHQPHNYHQEVPHPGHHANHSISCYTPTTRSSDISSRSSKYPRQPRGWGYKCLRGLFSSCNFVFWLLGCAVLGAGVWLHFSKSEYHAVLPISTNDYLCSATIAIAIGATVLVVGFLGCCGSLMQIRCMLLAYFIVVMMIVLIQCGIGLMGFAYKDEIDLSVRTELMKTIDIAKKSGGVAGDRVDDDGERIRKAWDSLQRDWSCCGVDDYSDWTDSPKSTFGDKIIMAYSAFSSSRDHHRGSKKHGTRHGIRPKKEDVLFVPESCCPAEAFAKSQRKKKKKDHIFSCNTGIPVSHLKKIVADSTVSTHIPVHIKGCYSGLKQWFSAHQSSFSYSVLGLAILQFLALLAAMMLFCILGEYGRFW